jgi:hypothetical protein
MDDLRTEYRQRETARTSAGNDRLSPWALFGIIVAGVVTGGVILGALEAAATFAAANIALRSFGEVLGTATAQVDKSFVKALPPTPQTVYHAPKSKDDCLGESGGTVNEQYNRCRQGWTETMYR